MINKNKKKRFFLLLVLFFGIGLFSLAAPANAGAEWAGEIIGGLIGWIIGALGIILSLVIQALVSVAQYSNFIDSEAVKNGWVIVRDICNMFFVLILLIIAFATILKLEGYDYKKWLPKLILMAILINFSKTICGLLIDVAQVVMMTFVNAFKDIAAGNLVKNLGLTEVITLANNSAAVGFWAIVGAYVLGLIYILISLVVVVTMLAMLVMRIVMIWVYVVLSPAAYLMSAFPGGQKYASQWWSEFTKNLIVGPVLAFFIWLSFVSLQTQNIGNDFKINTADTKQVAKEVGITNTETIASSSLGVTKASTPDVFIRFVIAIGMLIGGLKISQEIGGAAGGMAGKGMAAIQKGQAWTSQQALLGGKKLAMGDNFFARKFAKSTGWDFRPVKLKANFKATMESSKKKDESEILRKSKEHFEAGGLRSVALGMGTGEDYFNRYTQGFLGVKGIGRAVKDVLVSPIKRGQLGEEINSKETDLQEAIQERAKLVEKNKPKIEAKVNSALTNDAELSNLKSEQINKQNQIEALKNRKRNEDEQEEYDKLKVDSAGIKDKITDREKVIKDETTDNFFKKNKKVINIDARIKADEKDLAKFKEEILKYQRPVGLESRSAYRRSVEEAKSKYKTITNADELLKAFSDAKQRNDKFDQVAILEKLSGDGNLNEELKNKGYSSTGEGLYKYINNLENDFKEKKGLSGFSEAGRLQIMNDLGESEERVNHWDMAKMAGMNSKGEMESLIREKKDKNGKVVTDEKTGKIVYDDKDHAAAAYAEIMKMDPQKIATTLNRLAYGGEDGHGTFQLATLGKMLYKSLAENGTYAKQIDRVQTNVASNLSADHIVPILQKLLYDNQDKSAEMLRALKRRGTSKGGMTFGVDDMMAWVRRTDV